MQRNLQSNVARITLRTVLNWPETVDPGRAFGVAASLWDEILAVLGRGIATRSRLKEVAKRLVIERGMAPVTVRDIGAAAGTRNVGSLHYYFENKDALLAEIAADVGTLMDARLRQLIDGLDAEPSLRDIVGALIWSMAGSDDDGSASSDMKYMSALIDGGQNILEFSIYNRADSAWRRCMTMIRQRIAALPIEVQDTRLSCMKILLMSSLCARQAALERSQGENGAPSKDRGWLAPSALDSIANGMVGLLTAPHTDGPDMAQRFGRVNND